ncbi:MAG: DUF4860 domain-containing protein [Eubacterium sp.]|nr:DUF4860 domain-containing protein [Candidatus Colimonas fimequi]
MNEKRHHVDILFIIVLIGLFAAAAVTMALLGVNVYKTTANSSKDDLNTAALYFTQQVRHVDDKTKVRVANLDGENPALVLSTSAEGKNVETWYYVYNDTLKEVTVLEGAEVDPAFGQEVMALHAADFKLVASNLLQVTVTTAEGDSNTINLGLMGGGGN